MLNKEERREKDSMNVKNIVQRLLVVSMLVTILMAVQAGASVHRGAHVDEHWFDIIIDSEAYLIAELTHQIDMGGVPYPEALDDLIDAGFTITTTTRLGYTFTMENNRVWPLGTENGAPSDPENWRAVNFRKAIHRLVPKDDCVDLYAPLNSAAEWWLPPGQAYWINPDRPTPTYDPMAAIEYLDAGGFVQGTDANPYYDETLPWSSPTLRIDPVEGGNVNFEYYAIGPVESPIGFEMATLITEYLRRAGLTVDLVAGTWIGMVIRLTNMILDDYQMMTGVGITWTSLAPDILYDFTYYQNVPLWNFAGMNIPEMNAAGERMMSTLYIEECRDACFELQDLLAQYEPYFPMLLWNMFLASTGPYEDNPGQIGIVNYAGQGPHTSSNVWGKMLARAGRVDPVRPDVDINKWGLGSYLDTLNPLMADTVPDWQVLTNIMEGHYYLNPYTLNYQWWGAAAEPTVEPWVGPCREEIGGNEVYDATFNGTHYDGKPVATVTTEDLKGDDQLGMVTSWTLRPGSYWHDSDPGPDMTFDTEDDPEGEQNPVTAEDARFGLDLLRFQENVRYMTQWYYLYGVEVIDTYNYKVYEERRFAFAFEGHDVGLLAPKHIWEPFINPTIDVDAIELTRPDGTTGYANKWTDSENSHEEWFGWQEEYMEDPMYPGQTLTYLIGFGPFVYHLDGWIPGSLAHFESNKAYMGRHVCSGDIDLDGKVEDDDWHATMAGFGVYGAPNYLVEADICFPAQLIDLDEVYAVQFDHFGHYWGPDPVAPGFVECPEG